MANVGYAFVNFIDKDGDDSCAMTSHVNDVEGRGDSTRQESAKQCMDAFYDYRFKRHRKTSGGDPLKHIAVSGLWLLQV